MNKILTAVALSIALPAAAFAQAAPAPAGKMNCCDQKPMAECHKGMASMSSQMGHDMNMGQMKMGHDMKQPTASQPQPVQPQKQ